MKLRTLVVGLGKIGLLYNFSNKFNNYSNHCDVFTKEHGFELVGGVDISKKNKLIFNKKFYKPFFNNLNLACIKTCPDIIVLSIATANFHDVYKEIYFYKIKPKAFIIEKPGALNVIHLNKMFNYCKKNKINIFMNYTRDFSNQLKNIYDLLKINKIGNVKKIEIYYNKGIFNACSHYVSFLSNFYKFKSAKNIKIHQQYKKDFDYYATFDVNFKKNISFILVKKSIDERIKILGTKGYIDYLTEKNLITFYTNSKVIKIKNDFKNDLKNMTDFVKKNINYRSKCYRIFNKYILTLKILNQICQKF